MMSIGQVGPAGKAGDYYTHQDNYYVLGSMDERWVGQGAEALGLSWAVKLADFVSVLEGTGKLSYLKWSCSSTERRWPGVMLISPLVVSS